MRNYMGWVRLVYDTHNHLRHRESQVASHQELLLLFRKQIEAAKFHAGKRKRRRTRRANEYTIPEVSSDDSGAISSSSSDEAREAEGPLAISFEEWSSSLEPQPVSLANEPARLPPPSRGERARPPPEPPPLIRPVSDF